MYTELHSKQLHRRPVPEPPSEGSIPQQVEAASDVESVSTLDTILQDSDLTTSEALHETLPPPPYGASYGEIRNEKDGLGTSASVAHDGRVNIRINQLNRRLSQVFQPALHQQIKNAQAPPPSYIPSSLGCEEGARPPPPLNIVVQVVGSRGDVQPFVALGKVLKHRYGHRVRLATHPNFRDFVLEHGLEFFNIGGDPSQLMAFMVKNPGLMPGLKSLTNGDVGDRRREIAEYIEGCWRSCYEAGDGVSEYSETDAKPFVADAIIANPPSFAHIHCAEKLGIPLHMMFTMPWSPTQAFPHPLANIQSSNADPQLTNFISYAMIELLTWQGLSDVINRFRKKSLGLEPLTTVSGGPGVLERLGVPYTYCWSPALIPKPKDYGPHISISGFYFLNSSDYTPAPDLQAFLDAGQTPIYIGFGSIVLDDPDALTELIFEAVKKTGQRVLLSAGWGGIGATRIPENVFVLGNVPHDWLFRQVSCVIHHGGAGTTAAGIAAGRPTVVVPFFGDQPFWGAMIARSGAGPDPIPIKQLTADKLADAINFCMKPESLDRSNDLASRIAAERGTEVGAKSFHQNLEVDRLRCMLSPSRPAAFRIKKSNVRLSAYAACTLANANLLDFRDLKLYRPQEYICDPGPSDPVFSGGFAACMRTFGSMAMGIAEVPSDTVKMFYNPSRSSRQQSQTPLQASRTDVRASPVANNSAPTLSPTPGPNQTDLNANKSTVPIRSPSISSSKSSTTSNIERSSTNDVQRVSSSSKSSSGNKNRAQVPLERFVVAAAKSPMDISVGLTHGFHNMPKLWGDDTVRPQEKVTDLKSGMTAVGREFGFGLYDGVTGLVTQPWKGAQREGTLGFLKGFGKGVGGFATKPSAALAGVLGHSMKGIHKEVQKLFTSNVQNYIVASRVAQGYEEITKSLHAEQQDVVDRWKRIEKSLNKKRDHETEKAIQDILDEQEGESRGQTL